MAVRMGPWKAHFITQAGYGQGPTDHDPPRLLHLEHDPSERFDVAEKHADVLAEIQALVECHRAAAPLAESRLAARIEKDEGE